MDMRIAFVILGIVLVVSGCVQSTKDKEPVTGSHNGTLMPVDEQVEQHSPVQVISVEDVYPIIPAGPVIKMTLKSNNTDVPITSLSAILSIIDRNQKYDFPNINQSHPLMPGQTVSQTLILVGPSAYRSDSTYPIHINGTLQNGQTFNYTINVKTSGFGMALKTNLIVDGSGITTDTFQKKLESDLKIGYNGSPSMLILTQTQPDQDLFRGTVDTIIETDNKTYIEFSGSMGIFSSGQHNINDFQYSANASKIDLNTWRLEIKYFDGTELNYKINGHLQIKS